MEHEIFQSELKPSVNGDLLSKIIRSSSSGENSHCAAAMVLIFERSVRERHERMAARVRDSLRPGPVPEPKRNNEPLNNPIRLVEPQPVSWPPLKPQSTPRETAQNPKPASRSEQIRSVAELWREMGGHRNSVPDSRMSHSKTPKDTYLRCPVKSCRAALGRDELEDGLYCSVCPTQTTMLCANCGVRRSTQDKNCSGCRLRFSR